MKSIAILLTVFNRREITLKCLRNVKSLQLPKDITVEIWLTEDACTDGTNEAVTKEFPSVHIVHGDGSLFWNRGMWTAWDAASKAKEYDYYLWLNDDTLLYKNAIESLLEESMRHDDKSVIVGPTQFHDHRGISYGGFIKGRTIEPNGKAFEVETFNGNIVLVPAYVFSKVGNLDFYYRHSHGDTDYGLRARKVCIQSYCVGNYLGECDRHEKLRKCWDPNIPIIQRFKVLNSPTNYPINEMLHFGFAHSGFFSTIFHLFTLIMRVAFPSFWVMTNKARI